MAGAKKRARKQRVRPSRRQKAIGQVAETTYREASQLAAAGELIRARMSYEQLKADVPDHKLRALVHNDLAAIAAAEGDASAAISGLRVALTLDPDCEPARLNLTLLEVDRQIEGSRVRDQGSVFSNQESAVSDQQSPDMHSPAGPRPSTLTSQPSPIGHQPSTLSSQQFPKCLLLFITYNRLEYTRLALDAVLRLDYPALKIVAWDNASTDGTPEYLKQRLSGLPNVRLELSRQNMGVVHPMNAMWFGNHDAEVLAKVDNDTLVPPTLLRRLAECHAQSNHFGALSGFHFRKEGEAIADEKNVLTLNGARVFRQRFVGGCAIMICKKVLDQIGPIPCESQGAGSDRPFLQSGWTWYQQRLDELGYINGYPWPLVHVDHMEDTRSPHCIRTEEHQQYKQALRGMTLDEFTQELCVWKPH